VIGVAGRASGASGGRASAGGWSGVVLLIVIAGVIVFTNPVFYVLRAEIGGVQYVPAEEIYTASGIAGYHILWVDPRQVVERVKASPSLDDAEVVVQWPARVVILVQEREPALAWEQDGRQYWIDVNGNLMLSRQNLPELLRVVNEGKTIPFHCPGGPDCEQDSISIDPAVVQGAQQLKTLRPALDVLYYDSVRGLSFQDERGWRGYFGLGTDMNVKLAVYETLIADLATRSIRPAYIDVSNPDAPFYQAAP
jgi:cell division septal protein FtsQ